MLPPGIGLTLWDSAGHADPRRYLANDAVVSLLRRARPEIVQIHAGPSALAQHGPEATARLGAALGYVPRVWWGVALDWAPRASDHTKVARDMAKCAKQAEGAGAEMIVWNAESAWKAEGDADDRLARAIVETTRAFSSIAQGLTSFDVPGLHSDFAWRAWAGPGGVDVLLPQMYAGAGVLDGRFAPRGALRARMQRSYADIAAAQKRGLIGPNAQVIAYVQAHHVPASQTATELLDVPGACLWAAPSRIDSDGRTALLALCEGRRRGYGGRPGEAARFVHDLGCADSPSDRVVGPKALRALGVLP